MYIYIYTNIYIHIIYIYISIKLLYVNIYIYIIYNIYKNYMYYIETNIDQDKTCNIITHINIIIVFYQMKCTYLFYLSVWGPIHTDKVRFSFSSL